MANQLLRQPASFKAVQIIYYGLFAGQALIAFVLFYIMDSGLQKLPESPFDILIPGAVFIGIIGAYFIGKQRKNSIPTNGATQEKLEHFQASKILQFALSEGGNLVSLVLTFTMANTQYLMWFGIGLAAFVLLRPSKETFMEDYEIGMGEEFE